MKLTFSKDALEQTRHHGTNYDAFGPVSHERALRYQKELLRRAENDEARILIQDDALHELLAAILKEVK